MGAGASDVAVESVADAWHTVLPQDRRRSLQMRLLLHES